MADDEPIKTNGEEKEENMPPVVDIQKRKAELIEAMDKLDPSKRKKAEQLVGLLEIYESVGKLATETALAMGKELVEEARSGVRKQIESRIDGFKQSLSEYGDVNKIMQKIASRQQNIADSKRYVVNPEKEKNSRIVSGAQKIQNTAKLATMKVILTGAATLDAAHGALFGKKDDRKSILSRASKFGEKYLKSDAPIMKMAKGAVKVQKHVRSSQELSDIADKASRKIVARTVDEREERDAEFSKANAGRSKIVLGTVDRIKRASARKDAIIANGVRRVSGFAGRAARLVGAKGLARKMENKGLSLAKRRASRDSRAGKAAEALAKGIFKTKKVTFAVAKKAKEATIETARSAKKAVVNHVRDSIDSVDRTIEDNLGTLDENYQTREMDVMDFMSKNSNRNQNIVEGVASTNLNAISQDRKLTKAILKVNGFFAKGANLLGAKHIAERMMKDGLSISKKISTRKPIKGTAQKYLAEGLFDTHDAIIHSGNDIKDKASDIKDKTVKGVQKVGKNVKEGAKTVGYAAVGLGAYGFKKGKEAVQSARRLPKKIGRGMRQVGYASIGAIVVGITEGRKTFDRSMAANLGEHGEPGNLSQYLEEQKARYEAIRGAIPKELMEDSPEIQQEEQAKHKETQEQGDELTV